MVFDLIYGTNNSHGGSGVTIHGPDLQPDFSSVTPGLSLYTQFALDLSRCCGKLKLRVRHGLLSV